MERLVCILAILCLTSCNKADRLTDNVKQTPDSTILTVDTTAGINLSAPKKFSILVLPPYDEIANAGISPDIQEYLEREISKDSSVTLIKFPLKDLMKVPYQNVYDKKYCKPILDEIDTDVVIMTKLDVNEKKGQMSSDIWTFSIRIYDVQNDRQINSKIKGKDLSDNKISELIKQKIQDLIEEIKNNRQQSL
jgi:hypothetical protein